MEILAPGVGPEEAVRHALSIITPRGQAGGGIDVVPAPDGRTATGQVADRSFKAVASAQRSEKGTHLHITLQQSAGSP